jgi:integrase/recombinase XerD
MSFSSFLRKRQYLYNVSPATLAWYTHNFKWLPSPSPSKTELQEMVIRMREKGLKPTGCNSAIQAINAYLHWESKGSESKCGVGCIHLRVTKLKEDQLVLPTFSLPQVGMLTKYKPKGPYQKRLHLIVLLLLDSGCRIDEALSLRVSDCDLGNLLLTVTGKGRKQRRIPFSFELRRVLVRHVTDPKDGLLFATREGRKLGRRNVLRDVKLLCRRLGFAPPERTLHAFRHTFAVNYLRRGGSVFHLQKVLGQARASSLLLPVYRFLINSAQAGVLYTPASGKKPVFIGDH